MTEKQNQALSLIPPQPLITISSEKEQHIEAQVRTLPSLADTLLRAYQGDLTAETRRRHYHDLAVFCAFLWASQGLKEDPKTLETHLDAWIPLAVDAPLLREYLLWMQEEGYALGSVNVRFSTVRAYCSLLSQAGIMDSSTYAQIVGIKSIRRDKFRTIDKNREERGIATRSPLGKKAEPVYLTKEQVALLLEKIGSNTVAARRDTLLVRLSWFHALRVSEVCALTINSIDLTTGILTFDRPKTHLYDQLIQLSEKTTAIIRQVVADRMERTRLSENIPLFASIKPRKRGEAPYERKISPIIASHRIATLVEKHLGIEHVSMHDGRHHFANEVFSNPNNSLAAGMEAAGWKTPAMAMAYRQRLKIANALIEDVEK